MAVNHAETIGVPQMMTTEQVANRLQLHPNTVLQMLRSGELPGRKVRGSWRVHPEQLDSYMREGAA